LNAAMRTVMAMPDVLSDFVAQGATVETGTPQELTAMFREELASWGAIVKSAGIRME